MVSAGSKVVPIRGVSVVAIVAMCCGAGGMLLSFGYMASADMRDVVAGASGFVAGALFISSGLLSLTVLGAKARFSSERGPVSGLTPSVARFREARFSLLRWLLVSGVPVLNLFRRGYPWGTSFDSLSQMPMSSWGRKISTFLTERGKSFLPKYEAHDALHVLLGYDTDVEGEMRLQAFMVGNGTCSRAGWVVYHIGLVLVPELYSLARKDFVRGSSSGRIKWGEIENRLADPLGQVRNDWKIRELESS